uniref:triacylglycerol lipase n=1 Tax=Anas platyrhynchos platyrhynchos TaxID=8840 RepID=U3I4A2_ANAPP
MLDRERGWSVSFAGCGFLGVYHIGAATCLQEHAPHIIRDARHIYGASAGALAGAVLVGGGSLGAGRQAKEARKRNLGPLHPSFNVIKIIRDGLMRNLPENTHQLSSGRLCISLTRVSDGKNTLISNFNSKEEVVQALICSSFVPIYCGLIPPSFRGVRYVDGGISDNLPQYESKNTITVSPFAGECDICPKGNSANFHEMNLTNTSIQLSLGNLYRLTQALFPPEPKVLGEICEQGYSDAFKFLKENGMLHFSENNRVETSKLEVLSNQKKQNSWPLEKSIFESLPPRLRKALQEACKEPNGFYAQFSKLFPIRVISYLMLPYTLPVESAYSAAIRLVNWFPDMPADVRWMQEQFCQIAGTVYSQAKRRLLSVYSLDILLGNLTFWMVSPSACEIQVWKLKLKSVIGREFVWGGEKRGGLICICRCFFFCLFAKTLKEKRHNFLGKKKCILGDNFSFLFLKLQRTNLVVQVLL